MRPYTPPFKRIKPALGTFVEIVIEGVSFEVGAALTGRAFAEVERLERIFSRFEGSAELARLNRAEPGVALTASGELAGLLELGGELERLSNGAFRLMPGCEHGPGSCYSVMGRTVTRRSACVFDLGGLAKGHVVDRIYELLEPMLEGRAFSVNAGGDLKTSGGAVELRIPGREDECRFALEAAGPLAIATSSRLGGHLAAGIPSARYSLCAAHAASASVIASRCAVADAWTKLALFGDAPLGARGRFGVDNVLLFDEDGRLQ